MLDDLVVNTTIILSFIFVGIVMGTLGVLLMKFGVHIEDVMLDLRYLSVILASIIILIVRLLLTNYSLDASIYVDSLQQFIQLADDTLYSSKRNRRNQVSVFS